MDFKNKISEYIKDNLKENRYIHTIGVARTAIELAKKYGVDEEKAEIAALAHDMAKNMPIWNQLDILKKNNYKIDNILENSPQVLHGFVGGILARDIIGINDSEILDAISYHTTGRKNMSTLEKIIYIADYIEPSRDYPGVDELRRLTMDNLDKGVLRGLENTITLVIKQGQLIHPLTIEARNHMILLLK